MTNFNFNDLFASNNQDSKMVKYLSNGLKYAEKGNYNDAINQLLKAQQIDPSNIDIYRLLAFCYFQTFDTLSAILNYERIIGIDPYDLEIRIYLSAAYINQKRYDDALKQLEFVLNVQPSNPKALQNLAFLYDCQKNFMEAKKIYDKLLKIVPNDLVILFNFGRHLYSNAEFEQAIEQFEKILISNPNEYNSILFIAYSYLSMTSKLISEVDQKKKKGEKIPEEEETRIKDLTSKSIPYLEKSLTINPRNVHVFADLGTAYYNLAENEKAFQCYKQAIEIDPKYYPAYYNIACLYATQKDTINAMKFLEEALINGFSDFEHIEKDKDWDDYRHLKEFESVIQKYKK